MSTNFIINQIVKDISLPARSVENTIQLLEENATVPFIARYRKERTDGLDESQIRNISEKLIYYTQLQERKQTILATIESQGKLTPELKKLIEECTDKARLEDLYLPYKPKKRTRATIAKEKGLEPLAELIFAQEPLTESRTDIIAPFISTEKEVETQDQALQGAMDIIAEWISDNADYRGWIREHTLDNALINSKVRKDWKEKKSKFEMYYQYSEPVKSITSHRLLAMRRGTDEGVLSWELEIDQEKIIQYLQKNIIKNESFVFKPEIESAINDSYNRLISSSIEIEVFNLRIKEAEKESISVFSQNLKNLLLAPPAGNKKIMGIDPGFRTGCKVAIIDKNGDYLCYKAIFPHPPQEKTDDAEAAILQMIRENSIEIIAIGNGTASRETEKFIRDLLKNNGLDIICIMVSEAGASVYSASKTAISEFPDLDVTVRGAISIARRLQDPLAELVKIEPRSIGVGQYQHDVNQRQLKESLDHAVESCVNFVGVEFNTASKELLSYVSGIGPTLAENIIQHRSEKGQFHSRQELLDVPKFGPKAYEQCAGFMRLRQSENPLDNSGIHPETYNIVEKMATDLQTNVKSLISNQSLVSKINIKNYVTDEFGLPTLEDIINELKKPGLDPRKDFTSIAFNDNVNEIKDLEQGMELPGVVTNVTNFGAFVDIGVHQDGLVHISKLSNQFVKNPCDVINVGDTIKVKVLSVNIELKRISLERTDLPPLKQVRRSQKTFNNKSRSEQRQKQDTSKQDVFQKQLAALKRKFQS